MTVGAGSRLGQYVLERRLGAGAMGTVYEARDTELPRRAAVKVIHPHLADQPETVSRFEQEAHAIATVEHPNVVRIYRAPVRQALQDGEPPYIAMELIPGETLAAVLSRGLLPRGRLLDVLGQVAAGLDACHDAGVVHRDVKPSNVLIRDTGDGERVYLTDFGLARPVDGPAITSSGVVVGTAAYLSPEQARGERATRASDIYALGCIAFECLTGTVPFRGARPEDVVDAHARTVPPLPSRVLGGVPPAVDEVFRAVLDKNPQRRRASFPRAAAFVEALAAALSVGEAVEDRTQLLRVVANEPVTRPVAPWTRYAAALVLLPVAFLGGRMVKVVQDDPGPRSGPSPGPTLAADAASVGDLSAAQAALRADVPESLITRCRAFPERESNTIVAALDCRPPTGSRGVDQVLVDQFRDATAQSTAFTSFPYPDGKCSEGGNHTSTWRDGQGLACYINVKGDAVIVFEITERAQQVVLIAKDAKDRPEVQAALFRWWQAQEWSRLLRIG